MEKENNSFFDKMTARKQWSYDVAKEFLATKQMREQYRISLSDSNNPDRCYEEVHILSEKEITKYKTFLNNCWQEFKNEYPEEFDDDGDYVGDSWDAYFCDSLVDEGFESHWHDVLGNPHEATVEFVDLFNPVYACQMTLIKWNSCKKPENRTVTCWVYLTKEEYTQILAEYLNGNQMTMNALRKNYPEVYSEFIDTYGYFGDIDWSILFDAIKKEASDILSQKGGQRPKLY